MFINFIIIYLLIHMNVHVFLTEVIYFLVSALQCPGWQ